MAGGSLLSAHASYFASSEENVGKPGNQCEQPYAANVARHRDRNPWCVLDKVANEIMGTFGNRWEDSGMIAVEKATQISGRTEKLQPWGLCTAPMMDWTQGMWNQRLADSWYAVGTLLVRDISITEPAS
jgi:hypothetical protein